MGTLGDPASWRTEEFNRDWSLAAIKAEYAYARGLTGKGVRLGVTDSGTALEHPEFAGKDHRAFIMASLRGDGSRCDQMILNGPDSCYYKKGEEAEIDGVASGPTAPGAPKPKFSFGLQSHGTHVAGTVAANRDGKGMHGVAFGADLGVANLFGDTLKHARSCSSDGNPCRDLSLQAEADAFRYMYAQAAEQGVKVMNHSWGAALYGDQSAIGRTATEARSRIVDLMSRSANMEFYTTLADASRQSGLIQVVAAGNLNLIDTLLSAFSRPPIPSERAPEPGLPAALPVAFPDLEAYWVSVVNVDKNSVLSRSSMKCGVSAQWCLAAPGTGIDSTIVSASERFAGELMTDEKGNQWYKFTNRDVNFGYGLNSGTSMAAPHVTGALGLLLERFPYLAGTQVRDVMLTTATDLGTPGIDQVYGWGLLNLQKAIEGYGSLRVDTNVVMNQKAGGRKVWQGDAWDDWTNDIGGPGKLTKSGIGWLRLSGNNSFNGALVREGLLELNGANTLTSAVEVQDGQFLLNGSLVSTDLTTTGGASMVSSTGQLKNSNLTINGGSVAFNDIQTGGITNVGPKGLLSGIGRLGDTTVGGFIAPGNSIGTLIINGNYTQTSTGTYQAELSPGGKSDRLEVTGRASLNGNLTALPAQGVYYLGESFNLLNAAGGVQGRFAQTDFSAFSPFLKFTLAYTNSTARIDVARGQLLASAASTSNQRAVAGVADVLAINQGLPKPLTLLFPQQTGGALDALSGELHASTTMALVESSRYVRDAALSRHAGAASPGSTGENGTAAWVQAIGGNGKLDGDANTARTSANTNGLLVGIDRQFGDWQVGVLAGTGRTDLKQPAVRSAKSKIDNTHYGGYVNRSWGHLGLSGGVAWSQHELESSRQVAFAGFSDALSARYDGRTRQAFIEASYRFGSNEGGLEPYLQVARVEVDLKRISERGGAAALQGNVEDTSTTVATAGMRFDKGLKASFQRNSWLHLRGGVGYRKASGDRSQVANLTFASGSSAFAVAGAPIADNAVVAELGLSAWLTPQQQLELGYSGQFGSESRDQSASARWSVKF